MERFWKKDNHHIIAVVDVDSIELQVFAEGAHIVVGDEAAQRTEVYGHHRTWFDTNWLSSLTIDAILIGISRRLCIHYNGEHERAFSNRQPNRPFLIYFINKNAIIV